MPMSSGIIATVTSWRRRGLVEPLCVVVRGRRRGMGPRGGSGVPQPGPHVEPLRRQGPSGRRAARVRQPHANVAADRRRLAAAAASAEPVAGAGRLVVPHRSVSASSSRSSRSPWRRMPRRASCCTPPAHDPAAILAVAIMASNPNLLYLQSTPMTEPLLLGLLMLTTWRAASLGGRRHPELSAVGWMGARRRGAHALRSVALHGGGDCVCGVRAPPAWHAARRRASSYGATHRVSHLCGPGLCHQFQIEHRSVVRHGRLLRARPAASGQGVSGDGAVWWGVRQLGSATLACTATVALVFVLWRGLRNRQRPRG